MIIHSSFFGVKAWLRLISASYSLNSVPSPITYYSASQLKITVAYLLGTALHGYDNVVMSPVVC